MQVVSFVVPGTPIGKARARIVARKRRGADGKLATYQQAITPARTVAYENQIKRAATQAMRGRALLEGAVGAIVELYFEPPKSWSAKKKGDALAGKVYPTSKPDADNVAKAVFDGCNGITWRDDAQVVEVTVRKRYAAVARAEISISPI